MWLLEQQMMEIVKLGLELEPNHTVPLSLVDLGPTSAQDSLDPLRLALVVFFLSSIRAKISLALAVYSICTLRWWWFLVPASTLSKVHT